MMKQCLSPLSGVPALGPCSIPEEIPPQLYLVPVIFRSHGATSGPGFVSETHLDPTHTHKIKINTPLHFKVKRIKRPRTEE